MANIGTYTVDGGVRRASDGAFIPLDPANSDYQAILAALAKGDTIAPYVPPIIDLNAVDIQTINDALTQPGSIVRALGLLTLQEINKLRVLAGQQAYTIPQFTAALKAQIR